MSSSEQPGLTTNRQVTVRPTPRLVPFLVAGALVAAAAAAVVVLTTEPAEDYTSAASFGYLTFVFVMPALALGAVAWLVMERRSRRRSRTYDAALAGHRRGADAAEGPDDSGPATERTAENGPR